MKDLRDLNGRGEQVDLEQEKGMLDPQVANPQNPNPTYFTRKNAGPEFLEPQVASPRPDSMQGYLAHKKQPPPLGPPYDPRYSPTVGS